MKPIYFRRGLRLSSVGNLVAATVECGDDVFIYGAHVAAKNIGCMTLTAAHDAVMAGKAFYAIPCTQAEAENV